MGQSAPLQCRNEELHKEEVHMQCLKHSDTFAVTQCGFTSLSEQFWNQSCSLQLKHECKNKKNLRHMAYVIRDMLAVKQVVVVD